MQHNSLTYGATYMTTHSPSVVAMLPLGKASSPESNDGPGSGSQRGTISFFRVVIIDVGYGSINIFNTHICHSHKGVSGSS